MQKNDPYLPIINEDDGYQGLYWAIANWSLMCSEAVNGGNIYDDNPA